MKTSVVIPVFNAEPYIRRAVQSALEQSVVAEVILVEDASEDGSLRICEQLDKEHERVKLYRHPDLKNHGPGASRNLGIENAQYGWIAFLDADDFYLPNRFATAERIVAENHKCDGVCEAVGVHFDDAPGRDRWSELGRETITTLSGNVTCDNMFEAQLGVGDEHMESGHTCTPGFMVRKSVAKAVGLYPESLGLHQDTVFQAKVAALGCVLPGQLKEPVAMRGVHAGNRITQVRSETDIRSKRQAMWEEVYQWARKGKHLSRARMEAVAYAMLCVEVNRKTDHRMQWRHRALNRFWNLVRFIMITPTVLRYVRIRREMASISWFAMAAVYRTVRRE